MGRIKLASGWARRLPLSTARIFNVINYTYRHRTTLPKRHDKSTLIKLSKAYGCDLAHQCKKHDGFDDFIQKILS